MKRRTQIQIALGIVLVLLMMNAREGFRGKDCDSFETSEELDRHIMTNLRRKTDRAKRLNGMIRKNETAIRREMERLLTNGDTVCKGKASEISKDYKEVVENMMRDP